MTSKPKLNASVDLDLLPKNVREIAELIGIKATILIVQEYGGTRLWMGKTFDTNHPLVKLIGKAKTKQLWQNYQGERIMIDKADKALREIRNQEIIAKSETHTRAALAREYHLTEETIYAILREFRNSQSQMSLL